ncbi:hypothetical protein [Arthrobacter sp. CP30]
MPDIYYPGIAAGDAASVGPDGVVSAIVTSNTAYQVFEEDDTTFSNPLTIKTPSGLTRLDVPVGALPIFPDVYVVSENFHHIWKSGDLSFRRDSNDAKDAAVIAARDDAELARIAAGLSAEAAEEAAQFAQGPTDEQVDEALKRASRPSNLALAPDGVPYILLGANEISIYRGTDGYYYFTE